MRKGAIYSGVTETQASPLKLSMGSMGGTSGRSCATGTGQCAKRTSRQVCVMTQGDDGGGYGRCSVWRSRSSTFGPDSDTPRAARERLFAHRGGAWVGE